MKSQGNQSVTSQQAAGEAKSRSRKRRWAQRVVVTLVALVVGSLCGLMNGLIVTVGRIEPFIVTLGTMGIFRALITYMTDGGSLSIDRSLRAAYRPLYFGDFLGSAGNAFYLVVQEIHLKNLKRGPRN